MKKINTLLFISLSLFMWNCKDSQTQGFTYSSQKHNVSLNFPSKPQQIEDASTEQGWGKFVQLQTDSLKFYLTIQEDNSLITEEYVKAKMEHAKLAFSMQGFKINKQTDTIIDNSKAIYTICSLNNETLESMFVFYKNIEVHIGLNGIKRDIKETRKKFFSSLTKK